MSEARYTPTKKKNATLTGEIEVLDHCNKGGVPILFRQPHIFLVPVRSRSPVRPLHLSLFQHAGVAQPKFQVIVRHDLPRSSVIFGRL